MNDTNDIVMAHEIEESMGWMGLLDGMFYVVQDEIDLLEERAMINDMQVHLELS
jgi:hypothetical protein